MIRDPTLFPPPDASDDDAADSGAPAGSEARPPALPEDPAAPRAAERAGVAGHRRLTGHIRAGDRGSAHSAGSARRIQAPTPGRLRDVDTATQAQHLRGCAWAGYLGILMGFVFAAVAYARGWNVLVAYALGWAVGTALAFFAGNAAANRAAGFGSTIYAGGRPGATPPVRQYSLAESLKVRGNYSAARAEFERLIREDPRDYEPAARLARLWRDELNEAAEAAVWFRRALHTPGLPAGQALLLLRELVEVHVHRLGDPRPAFAELARLARTMPDTPAGSWAAGELARLKADLPRDEDTV
ncbi:MAG: hypothetical protein WEB88_16045 [Gemmatimonadota bacterium]